MRLKLLDGDVKSTDFQILWLNINNIIVTISYN